MKNIDKKSKKVLVGLSGGVDSSVTALLLQKEGYEVEGVFLDFWKSAKSADGFVSAQKVADFLGIKLHKVDAREEFKKAIVNEFIEEYRAGRTPNPCVICNPQMKFKVLLAEAEKRKADFVATGHYAQIKKETDNCRLLRAKDETKDQSYFLHRLNQKQLKKIIFPLGEYLKTEVREIARKAGLPTARRKESQDVCFIEQDNFADFLKKYIKNKEGEIADKNGNVLGKHYGLHFYTIGQRRGIDLGGDGPYYVIKKDIKNNRLIVSNRKDDLLIDKFLVENVSWISPDIQFPLEAKIKIRYHSDFVRGIIESESASKEVRVKLFKPQKAITSGQSAVFYADEEALGGGIIK